MSGVSGWTDIFGSSLTCGFFFFPFFPFLPFFPLRGVLVSIGFLQFGAGALAPRHLLQSLAANLGQIHAHKLHLTRLLARPGGCYEISQLASISAPFA